MTQLQLEPGSPFQCELQAMRHDNTALTVFRDTDLLSAQIWHENNRTVLLRPTVSWLKAEDAIFEFSLTAQQRATLDQAGVYTAQVQVTRAGKSWPIAQFELTN